MDTNIEVISNDNLRVVANGGGSDQARACRDGQCKICSEELEEDKKDEEDENISHIFYQEEAR